LAILREPEGIPIRIVHVKLARAPTLINRTFMNFLGSVRIAGAFWEIPEGLSNNSPTFQRWGPTFRVAQVPKGRLNLTHVLH